MLNITKNLSYGLRVLANLASGRDGPKQLRKIAEEENIPLPYLRKLISILEKAGMVKGLRGPGGGFILKRKPSQMSMQEIVEVLGSYRVRDCLGGSSCIRHKDCLIKELWQQVDKSVQRVFKRKTLATVIKKEKML